MILTHNKIKRYLAGIAAATMVMFSALLGMSPVHADPLPDNTPPVAESLVVPAQKQAGESVQVVLLFSDDHFAESITGGGGEFYIDADPGIGNGTALAMFGTVTNNTTGITYLAATGTIGTGIPDGAHTVYARAHDAAGNWSLPISAPLTVIGTIDTQAPALTDLVLSPSQKSLAGSAILTASATDNVGVVAAEYYVDVDPGAGSGLNLNVTNGSVTGTIGNTVSVGIHTIYVRARDGAGNWSNILAAHLVVFDPASGVVAKGKDKNSLVPSLTSGDVLPGLVALSQTDKADFDFNVKYTNGTIAPNSKATFAYSTGKKCNSTTPQNCHEITLTTTTIDWMLVGGVNASQATIQGTASVVVDSATTTNLFVLEVTDGTRVSAGTADHYKLNIYVPGAQPGVDPPLYQVNDDLTKHAIHVS